MKNIGLTIVAAVSVLCVLPRNAWPQPYPEEREDIEFDTQLLGHAQYQSAASGYEYFIRQYPHSRLLSNAYLGAGDSYFFLKEPEKAMEFYQEYEQQFPKGKEKWLVLLREAQCLYLTGKKDQVIAKLTSIDPSSVKPDYRQTYYYYLATALMDKGQLKEAGGAFEKVIEQKPTGELATLSYLRLAAILAHIGQTQEAVAIYDRALQTGDSLELEAKIQLIQGQAYMQAQQYDMAAITFERIVDDYPVFPVAKDAAVNWFMVLLKQQQDGQLISEYDQRFKDDFDDPLNGPIHLLAVEALVSQKQTGRALGILNALINSSQMTPKIKTYAALQKAKILGGADQFCDQAHISHDKGQDAQAAGQFMQCFDNSSDASYREEALFSAFLMYAKAGKTDDALKALQLYQSIFPKGRHLEEIAFNLAELYSQNKQYGQAVEALKAAEKSSSGKWRLQALFQEAYNLQLAGRTQEALKLYDSVATANSDQQLSLMALKNSALIYYQINDQDKAAEAMDAMAVRYPSNDLPTKDYLWLLEHWQQKNDLQHMLNVLAAVQKRPATDQEALGVQFFTAESDRMEGECGQAVPIYDSVLRAQENPYKSSAQAGKDMCLAAKDQKK